MNRDVNAEKSIGYCYNIAQKSPEERAKIQMDFQAAGMDRKLRTGEITRRHIEVALYDTPETEREYLRERLNHYMSIGRAK